MGSQDVSMTGKQQTSLAGASVNANGQNQQIGRRINSEDSAVSQLRKALQSLHMNQRVVSATITFDDNAQTPTVSIDGVPYSKEAGHQYVGLDPI